MAAAAAAAKVSSFGGMIDLPRLEGDALEAAVLRAATPKQQQQQQQYGGVGASPRSRSETPAGTRDAYRFSPRP